MHPTKDLGGVLLSKEGTPSKRLEPEHKSHYSSQENVSGTPGKWVIFNDFFLFNCKNIRAGSKRSWALSITWIHFGQNVSRNSCFLAQIMGIVSSPLDRIIKLDSLCYICTGLNIFSHLLPWQITQKDPTYKLSHFHFHYPWYNTAPRKTSSLPKTSSNK